MGRFTVRNAPSTKVRVAEGVGVNSGRGISRDVPRAITTNPTPAPAGAGIHVSPAIPWSSGLFANSTVGYAQSTLTIATNNASAPQTCSIQIATNGITPAYTLAAPITIDITPAPSPTPATAFVTWPAGGIVEATSGATLSMLPMHEPLIAQLFGAEMADALTTGCKAVAIASGTYPASYTPASLAQLPPAAQSLLAGQGYSMSPDGSGCVLQNGTPAAQAPIVAYEPNGASATYIPNVQNCPGIASLGPEYPLNASGVASGAQVEFPVIPGSNPGSCTVTVAASPAPSGVQRPGSGLVPVQVAKASCDFIGGTCTSPASSTTGTTTCDPSASGGTQTTVTQWFTTSSSTTGTIVGTPAAGETVTRTGAGTIWLVTMSSSFNMGIWPHCALHKTATVTTSVVM